MKTKHDGDCTFYRAMTNGRPYDGICCCGYGMQRLYEEFVEDDILSPERRSKERKLSDEEVAKCMKELKDRFGIES